MGTARSKAIGSLLLSREDDLVMVTVKEAREEKMAEQLIGQAKLKDEK